MINVLIVDDEPLAQDIIETYVNRVNELNLVGRCSNAMEANEMLQNNKIDLMFLDIQMPQLTGVDFLKTLTNPPLVIFTTAYSEYAVEGFELNAVDYLLKPISFDRFLKAVNKATEQLAFQKTAEESEDADHFYVKSDKKLVRVKYSEILYIEGLKDYVIIRMETTRVITLQTMKSLEDKLPSSHFRRIHRSYIVNIDKILAIDGSTVDLHEKGQTKELPIGKNYKDEILDLINKNRL